MTEPLPTAPENVKCPHCGHALTNETLDAIAAAALRAVERVSAESVGGKPAYVEYRLKPSAST